MKNLELLIVAFIFFKVANITDIGNLPWWKILIPFYIYLLIKISENRKKIKKEVDRIFKKNKIEDFFKKTSQNHWRGQSNWEEYYIKNFKDRYDAQTNLAKEKYIPRLNKTDVIADFGCADGWFTILLAPYVKKVYGYDLSKNLIEEAKQKTKKFNIKNAKFIVSDIIEDKIDKKFNHVSCMGLFTCIEGYKEPAKILKKIYNSLKSNGLLVLKDSIRNLPEDLSGYNPAKDYIAYYRTRENYINMIKNVGFKYVEDGLLSNHKGNASTGYIHSAYFIFKK